MSTAGSAARNAPTTIETIEQYLEQHEQKTLLRLLTCGSVDDGKSTLIGRLLHDSSLILDDQLTALRSDSRRYGTTGEEPDLALLMDGLRAEREQGITIDVAYRYFSTDRRKVIIADTPGHEQYTRNMVTGASTADLAIILVDASAGIQQQTRRHSILCSLLGIRHVILAVNKMDAVQYDQSVYTDIHRQYHEFLDQLPDLDVIEIPISALRGDNVVHRSEHMDWYTGPTLLEYLETVQIQDDRNYQDVRLPVQYVIRPDSQFRGLAGSVTAGVLKPGDRVTVLPSGIKATIAGLQDSDEVLPPLATVATLEEDIDVSRGDVLAGGSSLPHVGSSFSADIVWFAEQPLQPGTQYELKLGHQRAGGVVRTLQYRLDINTLETAPANTLHMNEIGRADIHLHAPLVFDLYQQGTGLGNAILIDRITNRTVAAVMIRSAGNGSSAADLTGPVTMQERARRNGHHARLVQCTGQSQGSEAAAASLASAAQYLERQLFDRGLAVIALDKGQAADPKIVETLLHSGLVVLADSCDQTLHPVHINVDSQAAIEQLVQDLTR